MRLAGENVELWRGTWNMHGVYLLVRKLANDNSLYGLLTIVLLVHWAMNFSQTSVCDVCKKCGQTSAKRAGCGLHSAWHGDRRIKSNISNANSLLPMPERINCQQNISGSVVHTRVVRVTKCQLADMAEVNAFQNHGAFPCC